MKDAFWRFIKWLDEPVVVPVCMRVGIFILIMAVIPIFVGLVAIHSPWCAVVLFGIDIHLFVKCLKMERTMKDNVDEKKE